MDNGKWCHGPMRLCNQRVWLCIWCGRVEISEEEDE